MKINEALEELAELAAAHASPDGYYTGDELARASGTSKYGIQVLLRKAKAAGRLDVQTVTRENVCGVMWPRPGYRILPAQ